jgi:hypothetical protein
MKATLGGTDCSSSLTWISDSAATFLHPPGVLPGLTIVMATDPLLSGDLQNAFGFAKPILTGISPAIQPTSGRSEITFYGLSFGGNRHDLARLKIGSTACFSTTWLSDSSARCRIPSGVSNQLNAVYSIGSYVTVLTRAFSFLSPAVGSVRVTVLTRAFSFLSPAVGSVRPSYGNTRGGNVISITGNSFGHGVFCSSPHTLPCVLLFSSYIALFLASNPVIMFAFRILSSIGPSWRQHVSEAAVHIRLLYALRSAARPRRFSRHCRQRLRPKGRPRQLVRC